MAVQFPFAVSIDARARLEFNGTRANREQETPDSHQREALLSHDSIP
jgi:hypothetical protein